VLWALKSFDYKAGYTQISIMDFALHLNGSPSVTTYYMQGVPQIEMKYPENITYSGTVFLYRPFREDNS